jgi:uncharacterized membrane protein
LEQVARQFQYLGLPQREITVQIPYLQLLHQLAVALVVQVRLLQIQVALVVVAVVLVLIDL